MKAEEVISMLGLEPLEIEGGYFKEFYRAKIAAGSPVLPDGFKGRRNLSTAIYYLLVAGTFSKMHRLPSDEIFHFYLGDPVEMLQLHPGGSGQTTVLGQELRAGMRPTAVVPAGTWQGCKLKGAGRWALMGTTVTPGFDYRDFEHGDRDQLTEAYPAFADQIRALTSAK